MNHTILRCLIHPDVRQVLEDDALTRFAALAWHGSHETSTNHWIPFHLIDEGCWLLLKTRGYRRAENLLGWGALIVPDALFDELEILPEDERDGRLMGAFGLSGDAARWWTARY